MFVAFFINLYFEHRVVVEEDELNIAAINVQVHGSYLPHQPY